MAPEAELVVLKVMFVLMKYLRPEASISAWEPVAPPGRPGCDLSAAGVSPFVPLAPFAMAAFAAADLALLRAARTSRIETSAITAEAVKRATTPKASTRRIAELPPWKRAARRIDRIRGSGNQDGTPRVHR